MTLALFLTALWLAIMLLVVVVCRMAAKGDRALQAERVSQGWEEELSAPVERSMTRGMTMPSFKAYRLGGRSAELQPTSPEHVRNSSQ
jgi:hypothetical protein